MFAPPDRFHTLYLPAVLMALDLPLPRHLLAHGHWTMDKLKMSKSRGNVADPFLAIQTWGLDAMRCYLMRVGGNSATDADYSEAAIEVFYKKSLAGQLGNLMARLGNVKIMANLRASGRKIWESPEEIVDIDKEVREALEKLRGGFRYDSARYLLFSFTFKTISSRMRSLTKKSIHID